MQPHDPSSQIRAQRADLTDYVVHLTRGRIAPSASPLQVLMEILESGVIRPTFAYYTGRNSGGIPRASVKGPHPVVCLTEQPLSAMLTTLRFHGQRYSGYGVAFYKPTLHGCNGRPVLYGTEAEIGRKIKEDEPGWEAGKEVYAGGLPPDLQYLWVRYDPVGVNVFNSKLDFTWEREWRVKFPNWRLEEGALPVGIRNPWSHHQGAIIVGRDADLQQVRDYVELCRQNRVSWAKYIGKIVSLERAAEKLRANDSRYARIETWPDED